MNRAKFAEATARSLSKGSAAIASTRTIALNNLEANPSARGHELVSIQKIQPRPADQRTRTPILRPVMELAASIGANRLFHNLGVDTSYHIIYGGHRYAALRLLSIEKPLDRLGFLLHQVEEGNIIASDLEVEPIQGLLAQGPDLAQQQVDLINLLSAAKREVPHLDLQKVILAVHGAGEEIGLNPDTLRSLQALSTSLPPATLRTEIEKTWKLMEKAPDLVMLLQLPHKTDPVPVLVFEPATEDERLAIEVLENQVRSDYSPEQVWAITQSLLDRGYKIAQRGRPTLEEGLVPIEQRNIITAVAQIVRMSERHVRRMLQDKLKTQQSPVKSKESPETHQLKLLLSSLRKIQTSNGSITTWIHTGVELLEGHLR
jgi:hypothetical protein